MEISQPTSAPVRLGESASALYRIIERFVALREDTQDFIFSPSAPPMESTDKMPLIASIQDIIDNLDSYLSDCIYSQFDPPRRACGLWKNV